MIELNYTHNCDQCKPIATTNISISQHPGKTVRYQALDIYLCDNDLVVRFGNNYEDHTYIDLRCANLLEVIRTDKYLSAGYSILKQYSVI